jgi:glycosyltransferase involved in cell wall biosynthesis
MTAKVSIAMATYCGAKFIDAQLQSLAEQSLPPAELVVTDDGSTDDTLKRIEKFAETAPFPVFIHRNTERLGYRKNFMRAASLCKSELVAFSDQDDIWESKKIEACTKRFEDPDVLLTYHNALAFHSDGREIGLLNNRAAPQAVNAPSSLGPWLYGLGFTIVLRKELLELDELWSRSLDQNEPKECMAHDQWFFFLSNSLGSVAYIDEPLVRYRQHDANLYGWEGRFVSPAPTLLSFRGLIRQLIDVSDIRSSPPFEAAARRRAEIMNTAQNLLVHPRANFASEARDNYSRLAKRYDARRRLYTSSSLLERLKAFGDLTDMRAYAGDTWSCTERTGIKDLLLGVSIGHLLGRRGRLF